MRQRSGFTLVELSIVLVIIGLLIGGILAAQSMISTAKINAQVRQLQQLDIATQNFISMIHQLPGDCNLCGHAGNNDRTIGQSQMDAYHSCNANESGECSYFFSDLVQMTDFSGSFDHTQATVTPTTYGNGKAFPAAVIGKGGVLVSQNYNGELFWILTGELPFGNVVTGSPVRSITPAQGAALDAKLDDGMATSGNVVIAEPNGGNSRGDLYPIGTGYTDAEAWFWSISKCRTVAQTYDLADSPDSPNCYMQIKANITY